MPLLSFTMASTVIPTFLIFFFFLLFDKTLPAMTCCRFYHLLLMALWIRHSSGNDSKQHRAAPRRPSKLQRHCVHGAEGVTSWIFCIINYLWVATSCYLQWTDGTAVRGSDREAGAFHWDGRVDGAQGGEGTCESVKYCTETPPAAANVGRGVKRASW